MNGGRRKNIPSEQSGKGNPRRTQMSSSEHLYLVTARSGNANEPDNIHYHSARGTYCASADYHSKKTYAEKSKEKSVIRQKLGV